jgi:hypothetical protein
MELSAFGEMTAADKIDRNKCGFFNTPESPFQRANPAWRSILSWV